MLRAYRPSTPPRRQPVNALAVDWSNPLTRGLVFLVPGTPGQTTDIAGKRAATVTGTLAAGGVRDAQLMRFDGSQALDYAQFGSELPFGGPGTVAWVQSNVSGSGYSTIAQFLPSGATAPVVLYQATSDAGYAFVIGPANGAAIQFSSIVGFLADNAREAFVVSSPVIGSSTPGDWSVYRGGTKLAAASSTQTFATFTGTSTKLGASERAGVEPYEGMLGCFAVWNRQLSDAESLAYNANPWQLFKGQPRRMWEAVLATVQYLRPASDMSAGTWAPSSGASLAAMLNESSANDATVDLTSQASTFEVALTSGASPGVTTGHVIRYRLVGSVTVSLMQGATTIASWSQAPTAFTTYAQTLTGPQAAAITNYAALSLRFQAT